MLNDSGQIGPAILLVFAVMLIPLTVFILNPVMDEINGVQQDQIDEGMHVSDARITAMNNVKLIWDYIAVIFLIVIGIWYLVNANRTRDGVV